MNDQKTMTTFGFGPRLKAVLQWLELAGIVVVILTVPFLFLERNDRKTSRQFRAWSIVLDVSESAAQGGKSHWHNLSHYRILHSHVLRDALEFLNQEEEDFQGITLQKAHLPKVNLSNAGLSDSDLTQANLRDANLRNANFTRAVLLSADLTGADLTGADLTGADLTDAKLENAVGVTQQQLNQACNDDGDPPTVSDRLKAPGRPCPEEPSDSASNAQPANAPTGGDL